MSNIKKVNFKFLFLSGSICLHFLSSRINCKHNGNDDNLKMTYLNIYQTWSHISINLSCVSAYLMNQRPIWYSHLRSIFGLHWLRKRDSDYRSLNRFWNWVVSHPKRMVHHTRHNIYWNYHVTESEELPHAISHTWSHREANVKTELNLMQQVAVVTLYVEEIKKSLDEWSGDVVNTGCLSFEWKLRCDWNDVNNSSCISYR